MKNVQQNEREMLDSGSSILTAPLQRRSFLQFAGASAAGIALVAAGRKKDRMIFDNGVNLGSGDIGILNYAYALEQLEAAFYTEVMLRPYSGMTSLDTSFLTDIRDHEVAHREFFKSALSGNGIGNLEVDFSSIDFSSRTSVLATAVAFEDLGATAYDGAGYLIKDPNYLLIAGKIVSVEARHAALIRELISVNTFLGDQVDASSVNIARTPAEVLSIAGKYVKTKINAANLPTG